MGMVINQYEVYLVNLDPSVGHEIRISVERYTDVRTFSTAKDGGGSKQQRRFGEAKTRVHKLTWMSICGQRKGL